LQDILLALYRSNSVVKRYYLCTVFHWLDRCVVKCVASELSPLFTAKKYQVQDYQHRSEIIRAPLREEKTNMSKGGRSANDSPTIQLVKKKTRNAEIVVK
jgi:hypothetical protein